MSEPDDGFVELVCPVCKDIYFLHVNSQDKNPPEGCGVCKEREWEEWRRKNL